MAEFTIEITFDVPHYRQKTYEAATLEEALALAKADDDWDNQVADYDCSGPERITGAWSGDRAYVGPDLTAELDGTGGQDRESYSDNQDRDSYSS